VNHQAPSVARGFFSRLLGGVQRLGEKRAIQRTMGRVFLGEVRSSNKKRLRYWAELPTRLPGEHSTLGELAEGEELGSNLLHVFQSSVAVPWDF
jgi:hypothetical protein